MKDKVNRRSPPRRASGPLGHGADQGADLFGDAPLAADHLSGVLRRDAQLLKDLAVGVGLRDGDLLRMLHQMLGHIGQKLFHCAGPPALECACFFSRSRTVSSGLSAGLDPGLSTVSVHLQLGGMDHGVVSADLLDETAIRG